MSMRRWIGITLRIGLAAFIITSLFYQSATPRPVQAASTATAKAEEKLSDRLQRLASTPTLQTATNKEQAVELSLPAEGPGSLMRNAGGALLVDIRMDVLDDTQLQALQQAGAVVTHVSTSYQVVTAFVDVFHLLGVAAVAGVHSIMEEYAPLISGQAGAAGSAPALAATYICPWGSARSEGDTQLKADLARAAYGVDGSGVKVGILSDSYNKYTGNSITETTDVASGDLPGPGNPCGYTTPVNVLQDDPYSGGTDEGRGMLQIVHDLAPAAQLSFATAEGGIYTFADNIRALRAAGADIIADDMMYYAEPAFQDGPVNQAITDVVNSGATYFTAAGNDNGTIGGSPISSYEAPAYRPTTCPSAITSGTCHDFNPSSSTASKFVGTLGPGGSMTIDLQWNEPWFGVTTNLDLYVLSSDGSSVYFSSKNNNITQGYTYELLGLTNNNSSDVSFSIAINRVSGTGTPRLKMIFLRPYNVTYLQFPTSSGGDIVGPSIFNHAATASGFSLGAVEFNDSSTPEYYSSRGPATHYYGPVVGSTPAAALPSPQVLNVPYFAATDGGCTTFFGGFYNGCDRFYGTSAAAPHAAAVAALLEQYATHVSYPLSRATMLTILSTTAQPVSGGDMYSSGAGLLDAKAALDQIHSLLPGPFALSAPDNGKTGVSTHPTLSWGASSGATSYEICIDNNNNAACDTAWISRPSASYSPTLSAGATYYWQVRARNGSGITEASNGWRNFITQSGSTVQLTTSPNPSVAGQPVVFTATVTGTSGTPTGSVDFYDGATQLGSATLNAGGQATFTTSTLAVGAHPSMTAQYAGDTNFGSGTSDAYSQTVNKANTTTSLIQAPDPSVYGQVVTFTASVSAAAPGAGSPSGTANFYDGASLLGSATLDASGQAVFTLSALAVGAHPAITAQYTGDASFKTSISSSHSHSVIQASTTTSVAASVNPSVFGQSVTFTATVSVTSPGAGIPTGLVTFYDNGVSLGSATLNASGHATFTTSTLAVGAHPKITAASAGNTNLAGSTSAYYAFAVKKAGTSTAVASTQNPSVTGRAVTFTATVGPAAPGAGACTGTVNFYDGLTLIGSATLNASGVATFTTATLSLGKHDITATYAGDAHFSSSASAVLAQAILTWEYLPFVKK